MLAFITTLRHPQNSANYGRVESLLRNTLESLTRQTSNDYVAFVVGNRRPSFAMPPRTVFVEVDFPPPSDVHGPRTGPAPVIWDKGTKNAVGLIAARDCRPDYVMPIDADDFVHRDMVAFVRDRPGHTGWVVKRGWVYSRARNAYRLRRRFYRVCGTSFIIPFDAYEVPAELTVSSTQRDIAEAFGERLEQILEHGYAYDYWRKHGRTLTGLPFPGAVYHMDTGENHSGNELFGPALPYREHLYRDFAIRPSRTASSSLWSAIGPAALKPDLRFQLPMFLQPKSYLQDYSPPSTPSVRSQ
ncbi:glycosyltransferase family A protein [Candidatus Mycobacterium wuenschmannii]|uniref:Glycosyltransferase family A protein n=1 Tax=Candidatus Mycobacterium wuenschmannii TaxID=3027808 RepID=A0ABY8VZ02_9MYCO|nr:glycosyltransferase family A protein [Candidatus Mycobacterium wuenschmannii]WIM88712.1 glycosyltransferase family A protein [Candidatus Mycobacterium wuenschmannii]